MQSKVIKKIETQIPGDEIGTMVILWDLLAIEKQNANTNPEWWEAGTLEERAVKNISYVAITLFDKVDVDITSRVKSSPITENLLKAKLISWASDKDLSEIGEVITEDEKVSAANYFTSKMAVK